MQNRSSISASGISLLERIFAARITLNEIYRNSQVYIFSDEPPSPPRSPRSQKLKEAGIMFCLTVTKMMSSTLMILASVMTMAALSGEALAALPAQCNPGYLDELPPRLRKICVAIARIWDVRDMNDFADDRGNRLSSSLRRRVPQGERLFNLFNEWWKANVVRARPSLHAPPTLSPRDRSSLYYVYRSSGALPVTPFWMLGLNTLPHPRVPRPRTEGLMTARWGLIMRLPFELLSEYRENLPRYDSAVKRQDVDHVFLRFGKRR